MIKLGHSINYDDEGLGEDGGLPPLEEIEGVAEYGAQQLREFDFKKLRSTTKKAWTVETSTRRRN